MEYSSPSEQFQSYLPKLAPNEHQYLRNLPTSIRLEVPYFVQTQSHWSGAAVVQMLHMFHSGQQLDQEEIASTSGLADWRRQNHESLKEDLVRYLSRLNYVPAMYYPGRYVLPNFPNGAAGADFIASNHEIVNELGFLYHRALIARTKSPLIVRIHFHTGMYPMEEDMAQVLDTAGHAVLIVGYDEDGFLVHDPWDRASWGGTGGGEYLHVPYAVMGNYPTVNCCLGAAISFMPFRPYFKYPRLALYPGREIDIEVHIELPGIEGITADIYRITEVTGKLELGGAFSAVTSEVQQVATNLVAGRQEILRWKLNTGERVGSYPIAADVSASLQIRAFPWEKGRDQIVANLQASAMRRLDIKDRSWLESYGRET